MTFLSVLEEFSHEVVFSTFHYRAKVCDYQFRIDEHTVCDATKLGNVARYINASCSPNCYTQIITANENKRIVIYAKKNIQPGEGMYYFV
jgi:SET domain-containing protein